MSEQKEEQKKRSGILWIIIALLMGSNIVTLWLYWQEKNRAAEQIVVTEKVLVEKNSIESDLKALQKEYETLQTNDAALQKEIDEKKAYIDQLLKEAQKHLPPAYTPVEGYPGARANASKLAATALLARVYLFTQQWTQAEAAATEIINSPLYQLETDINKVFLAGSSETIFEFVSFNPRYNTGAAGMFVPASPTARPSVIFTDTFLGKM